MNGRGSSAHDAPASPGWRSWLGRWWPALAPAAASLACAAILSVQQQEIRELKAAIQPLAPAGVSTEPGSPGAADGANGAAVATDPSTVDQVEITRLKAQAGKLASEIAQLEQMRAANEGLKTQLASGPASALTADETKAFENAREKAMSIACVNNLKQLGLAVRMWAADNRDMNPPNLLSMTNEMNTPKILVCPADTGRPVAGDWASFSAGNCSYEYLAPSAPDNEPTRIMFRCPIHGSVTLCDGSVQMGVAKNHPDWIVPRDGKLYFQPAQALADPPAAQPGGINPGQ